MFRRQYTKRPRDHHASVPVFKTAFGGIVILDTSNRRRRRTLSLGTGEGLGDNTQSVHLDHRARLDHVGDFGLELFDFHDVRRLALDLFVPQYFAVNRYLERA